MAKRILVLLAVAVLVLIGCEQSAERNPTSIDPGVAAKMRLNFSVPTNLNIDTGQVTITKGDLEYSQTVDLHAGSGTVLFTDLQPGLWQIEVGLYDAEGVLIYQGSGEATVHGGQAATAHIVLTELTGDLEITVEMPGGTDEGPVAYYPFNGNATDESGNDKNGTVVGSATPTTDRFGRQNSALGFDGRSGAVVVDQSSALICLGQPQYTICGWFNTANASQPYQTMFNTIPHRGIAINFNFVDRNCDNRILWSIGPGPGDPEWAFSGNGARSDYRQGQWYFFTIVKQGIEYSCYIDGAIDYEGVVPAADTYTEMVGCRMGSIGNIQFFNGKLDDYRIYDRALSGQEIQALYTEGGWRPPVDDTDGFLRIVSDDSWRVSETLESGWETIAFNDTSWEFTVAPAPENCGWSYFWDDPDVFTMWSEAQSLYQTVYLRRSFDLTTDATVLAATIKTFSDDDHDLYINGTLVASEWNGFAGPDLETDITDYLQSGNNVIAIKARDSAGGCRWMYVAATIQFDPTP